MDMLKYNYGVCVATSSVIRCQIGQIPVSKTLVRTFSYEPWYDGRSYSVWCPELGQFECAHLTEREFTDQFAVTCQFFDDDLCDREPYYLRKRTDKHFRLSTHRGGKHRAVSDIAQEPDDIEEEEEIT